MARTIQISDLDFKDIKKNIISYMKNDPTFVDYDFEASGLNTLMDILSYNTHYTSYYLNMVANEMFLDTARMRENVVSRAKMLGYESKSNIAPKAVVSIIIEKTGPLESEESSILVNSEFKFSASLDGNSYNFSPETARSVPKSSSTLSSDGSTVTTKYVLNDLVLIQGDPVAEFFVVDTTNPNQRFILSNTNADTTSISVTVSEDLTTDEFTEFKRPTDTMDLSDVSTSFFVQEVESGLYEVFFGDGVLGTAVESGNLITVEYITTDGAASNGIAKINSNNTDSDFKIVELNTVNKVYGGSDKETTDAIKFYAPRTFEGQNRAVTVRDYKTIIPKIYTQASSVNVWGGEDNDPPQYGRVFISIRPTDGSYLTEFEKTTIQNRLKSDYSILTILPEILDPNYTKLIVTTNVKYDNEATVLGEDELKTIVLNTIQSFSDTFMNEFDNYFRYSNFVSSIDNSNDAITNNTTSVDLQIEKQITLNARFQYVFQFSNEITPLSLSSTGFKVLNSTNTLYLEDDETKDLKFWYMDANNKKTYYPNVTGTVDYKKGIVTLNDLTITELENNASTLKIKITPKDQDVFPRRNQILIIDPQEVTINMMADTDDYNNNYDITTQSVNIIRRR
tara:strand:+ start:963 stop:2831 length:1869 start_codon:yes stop_codon:yes gene_type:complete